VHGDGARFGTGKDLHEECGVGCEQYERTFAGQERVARYGVHDELKCRNKVFVKDVGAIECVLSSFYEGSRERRKVDSVQEIGGLGTWNIMEREAPETRMDGRCQGLSGGRDVHVVPRTS
jgi:hypothetical protein